MHGPKRFSIRPLQCLIRGKYRSGTCLSCRKQKENGASPSLRSSASSPGSLSCLLRAASKLAHKTNTGSDIDAAYPQLRRDFQRLGVNLPLQGRQGPWEKGEATGSEGARLESADVGVGRLMAGPDRWSEQARGGRGGGPQGRGPSAALGSVVPEEPTCRYSSTRKHLE